MANRRVYNFSELYNLFTAKFSTLTDLVNDFNIGSVIRAIGQSTVFFVNFLQVQIDIAFKSFRIKTAEGDDLDNRVGDWQLTRVQASPAQGDVVFISATAAEETFTITSGTVVSTEEDVYGDTLDFYLDGDLTFPSGYMQATGTVICLRDGLVGNVASGTVTNIKSPIPGVDSVTNPAAFSGGAETETDTQLRKRVPLKINGNRNANEDSVLNAAFSVPGVTYAKVKNNTPSSGEFTVYFSTYNGIVSSSLRADVADAVEAVTAFCIVPNFAIPDIVYVDINLTLEMDPDILATSASGEVVSGVINAVYDFTQLNTENELKLSDIIVTGKAVDGVLDIRSVTVDGAASNKEVDDFEVIKLSNRNNIHVTVAS
jgi:uncharacterized phage protein gp47/JayE